MRTIEDLKDHYGRADEGEGRELVDANGHASGKQETETNMLERSIRVSLALMEDFSEK